jgi:hypothetical protein
MRTQPIIFVLVTAFLVAVCSTPIAAQSSALRSRAPVRTWGAKSKGVAMSLSFDEAAYPIGRDIPVRLVIQNFSADADIISGELPCFAGLKFEVRDSAGQVLANADGTPGPGPRGGTVFLCTGHGGYARYPKGVIVPAEGFTLNALDLLPSKPGKYSLVVTWEAQVANPAFSGNPGLAVDGDPSPFKPYAIVRSNPATFTVQAP